MPQVAQPPSLLLMRPFPAQPLSARARPGPYWPAWLVFACGLALTTGLHMWQRAEARRQDQERFNSAVKQTWNAVESTVEKYEAGLARLQDFFSADHPPAAGFQYADGVLLPTEAQWHNEVELLNLPASFAALRSVGYAHMVSPWNHTNLVAYMSQRLGRPYVWRRARGPGDARLPVVFHWSASPEQTPPYEEDWFSHPVMGGLADRVRGSGHAGVTGQIHFPAAPERAAGGGFMMALPVYYRDRPAASEGTLHGKSPGEQAIVRATTRAPAFKGMVYAAVDFDRLVESVFVGQQLAATFKLYDRPEPKDALQVNTRLPGVSPNGPDYQSAFTKTELTRWYGYQWAAVFQSTPVFDATTASHRTVWVLIVGTALSAAVALLFGIEVRARASAEQAARELTEARAQLHAAVESRETTRRDLHDGVLQSLYALTLSLSKARRVVRRDAGEAEALLTQQTQALDDVMATVRGHLGGERQRRAAEPLGNSLRAVADAVGCDGECEVNLNLPPENVVTPPEDATANIVNIVREAVSNARRHGKARRIGVSLQRLEARWRLEVTDDGAGFDPAKAPADGHGLRNIHARVAALGGSCRLESRPGGPTRIVVEWASPPQGA